MELGNMCLGNSRGNFHIKRGVGFEGLLLDMFEFAGLDDYGCPSGVKKLLLKRLEIGGILENDTFSVFPYYWGDCTCGYAEKEARWCKANEHEESCYQISYGALLKIYAFTEVPKKEVLKLYKKHNVVYDKENPMTGSAIVCTCSYKHKWAKFVAENDHADTCPLVFPNFVHKSSGLTIQWYKYPLRDSYSNVELTLEVFSKIIDDCIKSLKKEE